jgi:hypothetical protein
MKTVWGDGSSTGAATMCRSGIPSGSRCRCSAGDLGESPCAPGASGNLAMEVLLDMPRGMGIETGEAGPLVVRKKTP